MIDLLRVLDYTRYEVSLCLVFNEGCYLPDVPPQVKLLHLYGRERNFAHRKSARLYRKYGLRTLLRLRARSRICGRYDAIVSFLEGDALLVHDLVRDRAARNVAWVHCDLQEFHWTRRTFRSDEDERRAYGHMDTIVFCSRGVLRSFERLYDVPAAKICIYNVVDAERIRQLAGDGAAHEGFTVTSVGSLSEVKCHDRLLRAARRFADEGYRLRFRIVGGGALEEPLRRLRDELGLQESVTFTGFRKPSYPFLKASDIFVTTSRSEAASLVICEAMALGVPVVATRTAAAEEFLEDSRYGLVVGHSDEEIFEGLRRMADDAALREHYRKQGLQRVGIFSVEETLCRLDELL